ncbi:MAG: hypothetical protein R3F61_37095 [Myxococcota bacterium]
MWLLTTAFAQSYNITDVIVTFPDRNATEWATAVRNGAKRKKMAVQARAPGSDALTPVGAEGTGFASLEPPALMAVWMATMGYLDPGVEYDLVLGRGKDLRPVTVWFEDARSLVVSQGPSIALPPEGPPIDAIVQRYALVGSEEQAAVFEPRVRGVIDQAFARLSPLELAALSDVTLIRLAGKAPGTKGKWINTAEFRSEPERGTMVFFDDLLRPTGLFVGPVDDPSHPALHTVLHEVGHAIDSAPLRLASSHFNRDSEAYNAAVDATNAEGKALRSMKSPPADRVAAHQAATERLEQESARLSERRTALERHVRVSEGFRARFSGVTMYGDTSDTEAFAEAFALFHLDPAALERVSPDAAAWFRDSGHLAGFEAAGLGSPGAPSEP